MAIVRIQISLVKSGGSFDLFSIHSSEAGGSMFVPMVDREIIIGERVEEIVSHSSFTPCWPAPSWFLTGP